MFRPVESQVNFPALEREILNFWQQKGIVGKYLKRNKDSQEKFSFIDGPITANNPMGVHHAWGRTYKDLWQRFFNMLGRKQRFQNGFDEQGLWVEVEVEKELGLKTKKDIENLVPGNTFASIAKFVTLCKERVAKFSKIQEEQSQRLGYFMDWDNSYHTSSDQNNYAIWHYLKTVHEKGWLYKGRDSVPWCPRCGTAISQHEILAEEYKEVFHKAVYIKFPIISDEFKGHNLLVWTTTPWTIPGNVAVAIDPEKDYVVTDNDLIVMKERLKELGLNAKKPIKSEDLIGQMYEGPFDKVERVSTELKSYGHRVISAEGLVTEVEGTGLVHIAPGAGEEDFKLHKEQNLPVIELIDEEATYINGLGEFSGKNAKKHPELIIEYLEKYEGGKFFFKEENYKHRYPTCWRCKTELVWRVVDEWYIAMDKPSKSKVKSLRPELRPRVQKSKTYREQMKAVIKEINWIPKWGYERELDWLNNLHDWLISKKRYWGLALPIWECTKCGHFEVIGSKEELQEKAVEGGQDFAGNSPHRPWVDGVKVTCSKCGALVSRIPDVGNPWLDAGIVPFSTLKYFEDKDYWQEWFPADFITESFPGQFKNWFYSLIAMSTVLKDTNPFKTVLGFATLLDENGEEMHKSKGNAIEFNEGADKIGVDVMRWMYAIQNPSSNMLFGYRKADETRRRFYLILWNVYSFFVTYANIDGWETTSKTRQVTSSNVLDKWILSKLNGLIRNVTKSLSEFDAQSASLEIENFIIGDLSTWYLRRSRDRFGYSAIDDNDKNAAYQTLYSVLENLSRILASFTPFIAEEIYQNLTAEESVHLSDFPTPNQKLIDQNLEEEMILARNIVELAHSQRKESQIKVRQPLAKLTYSGKQLSKDVEKVISFEVNVKEVVFKKDSKLVLDTKLTDKLKSEGEARELIRQIQQHRKEAGCELSEKVQLIAPSWPKEFEKEILRQTLSTSIEKGETLTVKRN